MTYNRCGKTQHLHPLNVALTSYQGQGGKLTVFVWKEANVMNIPKKYSQIPLWLMG